MKKVLVAVAVIAGLAFICSTAVAKNCWYHQWPEHRKCVEAPKPAPVAKPAPVPEKIVLRGVTFDTGSATIKPLSYPVLDANAETLTSHRNINVKVIGYTDDRGSAKLNENLSAARARSVKEYLIGKGVDSSRISSEGKGPAEPVADNKTNEGRAENRRIELHTAK